jgi:hypothetical protein
MMMEKLSWIDIDVAVESMVMTTLRSSFIQYVYGVPRGGIPIAIMVAQKTGYDMLETLVGTDPKHVWVVDEIIDSGATRKKFEDKGYLFTAAFIKSGTQWIEFPWERMIGERPPEEATHGLLS